VKGGCGAAPAGIWGAASCRGGVLRRLPHSSAPSRRLSPKHRDDGRKTGSQRSSGSRSPSPSGGSGWGSPQQNGGSRQRSGAHGGRSGSAHSPADVRTLGFAEGFRAERGGGAIAGGGASLRHGAGLLPPSQPSATRGPSGAGVASRARLLRPPGPRGLGPPTRAWQSEGQGDHGALRWCTAGEEPRPPNCPRDNGGRGRGHW
jgi:hypothetical protein